MSVQQTKISPIRLRQLPELRRLFVDAVNTSFTYFSHAEQKQVIDDHTISKLFLAAAHPRRIILGAHHEGKLVGYAVGSVPTNGKGQIFWLYIHPNQRGNNTGLALLSRMLRSQRELGALDVTLATYDHRSYYERQGFVWKDRQPSAGVELDIMSFPIHGGK